MIDTHCHLNFKAFEKDCDEVIKQAAKAGVEIIINTGTQISSSRWAIALAEKYENLYAVIGIHPHHADKTENNWLKQLEQLAKNTKVIGIGEIGMDYYEYKSNGIVDPALQEKIFIQQIELAHKFKLPLQIHSRTDEARKDIIKILKNHKNLLQNIPGTFHCMAGSIESLKSALEMGFYIGFDGNSMYDGLPPNEPLPLSELINYTPLDRIVIETDSPYLTPPPYKNTRNEPKFAIITAQFIARLKKVSFEKLVEQTDRNVYNIYKKLIKLNHD